MPPIVVLVRIQLAEIVAQDVRKIPLPAVAPFVTVQTIAQSLVRDALNVDIQRGVNTQAALVDSRRSIRRFEILANLFEEIRCKVVARILNVQPERGFSGVAFLRRRDLTFFLHAMDHQIAAAESGFRIRERRKFRAVDHSGQQRRFLKFQVCDGLAKIKLRGGGKTVIPMRQVNLVGIHREDLRFRIAAFDLQREKNFLHLSAKTAVAAVEE